MSKVLTKDTEDDDLSFFYSKPWTGIGCFVTGTERQWQVPILGLSCHSNLNIKEGPIKEAHTESRNSPQKAAIVHRVPKVSARGVSKVQRYPAAPQLPGNNCKRCNEELQTSVPNS